MFVGRIINGNRSKQFTRFHHLPRLWKPRWFHPREIHWSTFNRRRLERALKRNNQGH
jgi:hypothetical protein